MRRLLKKGDRVRTKTHTIGGWKGTGTVLEDETERGRVIKLQADTPVRRDDRDRMVMFCDFEVTLLRTQRSAKGKRTANG
jgi:hypothetical protein